MNIRKISWTLVLYLALIEGISLYVLQLLLGSEVLQTELGVLFGFPVGFIPMFIVLLLYRGVERFIPVKFNGKRLLQIPLIFPSFLNGIFLMVGFLLQEVIPFISLIANAILVSISFLLSGLILLAVYNRRNLKMRFSLNQKRFALNKINLSVVWCVAIFEFFILLFMAYFQNLPVFLNGLYSGFLGGLIGWFITSLILLKKPLKISESL